MLFKINELLEFHGPLSASLFVFGMSNMQFCKAQVRGVKAKPSIRLRRGLSKPMLKASDKNIRPTWMRGQLGKIHIERIDVLCADVTHEDARIIRRLPAPRPPEAKVAAQTA